MFTKVYVSARYVSAGLETQSLRGSRYTATRWLVIKRGIIQLTILLILILKKGILTQYKLYPYIELLKHHNCFHVIHIKIKMRVTY